MFYISIDLKSLLRYSTGKIENIILKTKLLSKINSLMKGGYSYYMLRKLNFNLTRNYIDKKSISWILKSLF